MVRKGQIARDASSIRCAVSSAEKTIELDEVLLLGTVLALGLLIFALRRFLEQKREIARRIEAERYVRELAFQDPLTGLANRRQFVDALRVAASSLPAADQSHAVLMLDLNGFKKINDTHGHATGDELLIVVGQRLMASIRPGDLVARLGGDEFIILALHLMGPEAASNIASRIILALSDPIVIGGAEYQIGTGIGIALYPQDGDAPPELLRKADVALYRAKAEHRSAMRFFEKEMDALILEREEIERKLRDAVASDSIEPRFRPSFNLKSGAIVAFEAVPTWMMPDGELIPPERFLPIAEETGLIHAIGIRLLQRACLSAQKWPASTRLSLDILPGQLSSPSMGATILEILSQTGLDPRRLEIDNAENMIVRDLETAKAALAPLRAAGVALTLDHLGTGYSNLSHLRELKPDKVKIDRRFTENLEEAEAETMVRALAGFGQGLGLVVSAEGSASALGQLSLLTSGVEQSQSLADLYSEADVLAHLDAKAFGGKATDRP